MVWGGILVFFAFRFKTHLGKLINAATDRIKNVQGYKRTKDGHELIFSDSQPAQSPTKLESTPVNIPIPTDTIGLQQDFEALIMRDLEAANIPDHAEKERILVSHLAATQLNAGYERVNSTTGQDHTFRYADQKD